MLEPRRIFAKFRIAQERLKTIMESGEWYTVNELVKLVKYPKGIIYTALRDMVSRGLVEKGLAESYLEAYKRVRSGVWKHVKSKRKLLRFRLIKKSEA